MLYTLLRTDGDGLDGQAPAVTLRIRLENP